MCEEKRLMRQIQMLSFAVYESALYLDAYPSDRRALEYYSRHQRKLDELTERYERRFGPLTMGKNGGDAWKRSRGPWPWEYSCD